MKILKRYMNKTGILLPVLVLTAVLGISGAYAMGQYDVTAVNELKADTVDVTVEETTDGRLTAEETERKEAAFHNTGSSSVFLRMTYTEYWEKEGKLLSNQAAVAGKQTDIAQKNWSSDFTPEAGSRDWYMGADGWYYYRHILKAGESTPRVLESVTFPDYSMNPYSEYKDAEYNLYFKSEVVQASDGIGTLNSDEVNEKATDQLFGVKAAVGADGTVVWTEQGEG